MLKATVCTGLILAAGAKSAAVGPGDEYNGVKLKNEKESAAVELPVEVNVNDQGQYVYSNFSARSAEQSVQRDASLWEMRVGVRYTF